MNEKNQVKIKETTTKQTYYFLHTILWRYAHLLKPSPNSEDPPYHHVPPNPLSRIKMCMFAHYVSLGYVYIMCVLTIPYHDEMGIGGHYQNFMF